MFTIEIIVSGMYFVTEKLMRFVVEPCIVLKISGPTLSLETSSHTAFFSFVLTKTN